MSRILLTVACLPLAVVLLAVRGAVPDDEPAGSPRETTQDAIVPFVGQDTPPPPAPDAAPPPRERLAPVPLGIPPTRDPAVLRMHLDETDPLTGFAANAFPPTVSDTEWHRDGWWVNDCLRCHETGVGDAPAVRHRGLTERLLTAKCRTCHVLIEGQAPRTPTPDPEDAGFALNAFPPMIPSSGSHQRTWTSQDCRLCHDTGVRAAPIIEHEGLPEIYLDVKCRTCHVQVRSHENDPWNR